MFTIIIYIYPYTIPVERDFINVFGISKSDLRI